MDSSTLKDDARCQELADPDKVNFALSLFILVGILISYLPQHIKIVKNRSSAGLSPYFILLGTTSGTSAIANILLLPTSRKDMACCAVNSSFACFAGLLGVLQIAVQWSCFFTIFFLFIVYFPQAPSGELMHVRITSSQSDSRFSTAIVGIITMLHFLMVFITSVFINGVFPGRVYILANVLGGFAAGLASVQYIPQIYETWRRGNVGNLSIGMMCVQTPGSFVFAASLIMRLGKTGWSAWVVYLVTGTLQGIILAMGIYWEIQARRQKTGNNENGPHGENERNHEREPLLAAQRGDTMISNRDERRRSTDSFEPTQLLSAPNTNPELHNQLSEGSIKKWGKAVINSVTQLFGWSTEIESGSESGRIPAAVTRSMGGRFPNRRVPAYIEATPEQDTSSNLWRMFRSVKNLQRPTGVDEPHAIMPDPRTETYRRPSDIRFFKPLPEDTSNADLKPRTSITAAGALEPEDSNVQFFHAPSLSASSANIDSDSLSSTPKARSVSTQQKHGLEHHAPEAQKSGECPENVSDEGYMSTSAQTCIWIGSQENRPPGDIRTSQPEAELSVSGNQASSSKSGKARRRTNSKGKGKAN